METQSLLPKKGAETPNFRPMFVSDIAVFVLKRDVKLPTRSLTHSLSAHVYCGETAGWIEMPFGTKVGLSPGDFVLDGDAVSLPKKVAETHPQIFGPCLLWPNGGWIKMALGMEVGLGPVHIVLDGDTAPLPKKGAEPSPFSAHLYCGQTADVSRCHLVWS